MTLAKRRPDGACHYCGSTSEPLTWDHIVPRVLGGTDGYVNLIEACEPCNIAKDGRFPDCDCDRCSEAIAHYRQTRSFVGGAPVAAERGLLPSWSTAEDLARMSMEAVAAQSASRSSTASTRASSSTPDTPYARVLDGIGTPEK